MLSLYKKEDKNMKYFLYALEDITQAKFSNKISLYKNVLKSVNYYNTENYCKYWYNDENFSSYEEIIKQNPESKFKTISEIDMYEQYIFSIILDKNIINQYEIFLPDFPIKSFYGLNQELILINIWDQYELEYFCIKLLSCQKESKNPDKDLLQFCFANLSKVQDDLDWASSFVQVG